MRKRADVSFNSMLSLVKVACDVREETATADLRVEVGRLRALLVAHGIDPDMGKV